MATIDEEIAAIREAIAAGVKRVRTRSGEVEKEVEYPSFADLKQRLSYLEAQKATPGRARVSLGMFFRGR